MSVMSVSRLRAVLVSFAFVAIMGLGLTASAGATKPPAKPQTFNNVQLSISGGNATALAACVNYAKVASKHGKVAQSNFCKNLAKAQGGNVTLKNVDVFVSQSGSGTGTTANNVTISITGGDATAIAACVNYLHGGASAEQKNVCANSAVANGGDVTLKNVTITIVQEG